MKRLLAGVWKILVGTMLSMNVLLSVFAVGWTYRLVQQVAWKGRSGPWPNFIRKGNIPANLRTGVAAVFNTLVVTSPAAALWIFAWYSGWDNSFNKGYEQFWIGPLAGWIGVALFIAAMFYLPMAQARQAVTGDWRAFYDFKTVRTMIRQHPISNIGLAIAYKILSLPILLLKTAPMFFGQSNPEAMAAMTDAQVVNFLNIYFFFATLVIFPLFIVVHVLSARLYTRALRTALGRGELAVEHLHPNERAAIEAIGLPTPAETEPPPAWIRVAGWVGWRTLRTVATVVLVFVWFTYVAQVFVGEFLNYHSGIAWVNNELVHLPWVRMIPDHLTP